MVTASIEEVIHSQQRSTKIKGLIYNVEIPRSAQMPVYRRVSRWSSASVAAQSGTENT